MVRNSLAHNFEVKGASVQERLDVNLQEGGWSEGLLEMPLM